MQPLRLGSLFSGYGGLDQAANAVYGSRTAWHCDIDPGAAAILAHNHPETPNHGDITAVDWAAVEPVDILTGGFPCQDVSLAGRRAGLNAQTRSGLWAHMAHAIHALQPRLVVIENVRGLLSAEAHSDMEPCTWCLGDAGGEPPLRALGAVLADLAGLGFDAEWASVRASEVGAAHQRERVFLLAWPAAADPDGLRVDRHRAHRAGRDEPAARCQPAANAPRLGHRDAGPAGERGVPAAAVAGRAPASADADGRGQRPVERDVLPGQPDAAWGSYGHAVARWAGVVGWPAPRATDDRGRLSPAFVEWLMGLPAGHVTDVPGLTRTAQLKALGNGVVPQQAEAAIRLLHHRATATDASAAA